MSAGTAPSRAGGLSRWAYVVFLVRGAVALVLGLVAGLTVVLRKLVGAR